MSSKPEQCPVCRQPHPVLFSDAIDYEYFSTKDIFQYYQCQKCLTIFIDPVPADQLNRIYPPNYYSFHDHKKNIVVQIKEWMDKRFFKKILKQIDSPGINILDVGGGTGWIPSLLKKTDNRIAHTQIVDLDAHAREAAIKAGHEYFEGRIEDFETGKKYHLVILLNLIEHVADPLAILKKCEQLLAPGGQIVIKTPNTKSLDAAIFRRSYWGGLHCPRHWVIFSEKSFRLLVSETNLLIHQLKYTQGAPFWAFSIIAFLFRKKLIKVSSVRPIIFHWLFAPLSALFAVFDFLRLPFSKTSQMFIILCNKESK